MNTLQQFAKCNKVASLDNNQKNTMKGGGIANGKNGCPIGYEPNDPLKFMAKMVKMEAKM